jgi:hypothetical protein
LDRTPKNDNVRDYQRPFVLKITYQSEQKHHSTPAEMRIRYVRNVDKEGSRAGRSEKALGSTFRTSHKARSFIFEKWVFALETLCLIKTVALLATLQASKAFQSLIIGIGPLGALVKTVKAKIELVFRR